MGTTAPQSPKRDNLSLAFRDKLKKVTLAGDTQSRVQRIMLALGYAMALTPKGSPGFTRPTMYKGQAVNIWVTDESMSTWPANLLEPVWVGFYTPEEPVEMVQDLAFPRLMDFLQAYHPEAFQAPSEVAEGEG